MDDQVLIHILETACREENLVFQVMEQERHLHVFLNREPEQVLNYQAVGKKIYQALSRLSLTDIEGVCLYGRVLGEEEPDWEAKFRLPQAKQSQAKQASAQQALAKSVLAQPVQNVAQRQISEAETYVMQDVAAQRAEAKQAMATEGRGSQAVAQRSAHVVAAPAAANYPLSDEDGGAEAAADYEAAEAAAPTVSVVADVVDEPNAKPEIAAPTPLDENFDLSDYCFIRNRMLLTADIVPPSKAVAKQINGFHGFSMAEKQRMMPQLELFFKGAPTFSAEGLNEAQRVWFQEMDALTGDDTRKAPIWLSRYCADVGTTLDGVARVFDPSLGAAKKVDEAAEESATDAPPQGGAAHSISGSVTGGMAAPPRSRSQRPTESPQARPGNRTAKPSRSPSQPMGRAARVAESTSHSPKQWIWPGIVVMVSVFLMCLGMLLAKQPAAIATGACTGSDYPEQCHLATQIVGTQEAWDAMEEEALPLPTHGNGEMRENALAIVGSDCGLNGAVNAGHRSIEVFNTEVFNREISASRPHQVQEILPGILLGDVEYPSAEGPGTVRTACLFSNEAIPNTSRSTQPFEIASAVIPVGWPAEAYDNSAVQEAELRGEQAFHPLFTFGSTMLFTTVGLFAAALLRLSVTAYDLTALSQAAIVMSIFEAIFDFLLPLGGILLFPVIIAQKSLALGLTGAVVPNFKVDWSSDYLSVASCIAVMSLVRLVLRWIMILTILGGAVA